MQWVANDAIVEQIQAKGADYVIALKGNQGTLNEEVKAWFQKAWREKYSGIVHEECEDTDTGHGRIEVRRCLQVEIDTQWLKEGGLNGVVSTLLFRLIQSDTSMGR